jgi:hypothetical protein
MDDDLNDASSHFIGTVNARGIAYGDDMLYVTDHSTGEVYRISSAKSSDSTTDAWV